MSKMSLVRALRSEASNLDETDADSLKDTASRIMELSQKLIEVADITDDQETDMQVSEFEATMERRAEEAYDAYEEGW